MTSKIKVLHVTYDMRIGGTEMVIKNLIEGSDKTTFEMSVLCIESPLGPFSADLIADGIKFHELNRQPGFDKALIKNIRNIIKKEKIDILHCHQYTPWVYGVIAAMLTKTKVIFTEHGRFYPDTSSWKRKLVNPILNKFTSQVTAISQATKQALVDYENFPDNDIEVIYNGIKGLEHPSKGELSELRAELGLAKQGRCIGTISRFDPIKNHLMMIRAFHQCLTTEPNLKLIIVGDGEMRPQIESEIEKLNIQDKVILTGYKTNPQQYLALMEVFLLSSFSEGTSMTLLEAMSLGKPCVVTDAGGNKEVIADGENGIVTENDNQQQFSQAINKLITTPSLSKQYSGSSLQIFKNKFDAQVMYNQFALLYK
ncbi:glycosyltransferase [Paraglaciecola aquimarina]|uniref:Glycosyltransferase n=1 Tax=Paraglaciecola algarum TaxID=3050085 RepID=A0ABS9D488_9ALTE|nr:glycosyltransferase [Paraglaciecola sp. G1-23]MCF2947746.1 glycosyltransferase [Paraglaciecola sp. G1-23]